MNSAKRTPLQLSLFFYLLSGVLLCTLFHLTISARLNEPWSIPQIGEDTKGSEKPHTASHELELTNQTTEMHVVPNLDKIKEFKGSVYTESPLLHDTNQTTVAPEPPQTADTPAPAPPVTTITPASPGEAPHIKSEYPKDLFSIEDRRRGWVILHIIGMVYMFISLAIVCDEFFVPALGVITDKLAISDDVAGATIMAAGRSSPKLFTCVMGVFMDHKNVDVGIGKIVGPAVFNILSVIGVCSLFSREVLHLTWWPLFRDVSFYILAFILLIIFFLDNVIMWWESIMLVTSYSLYLTLIKFNVQIEQAFKSQLYIHKTTDKAVNLEEPEKRRRGSVGDDGQEASEDAKHNKVNTDESCRNEENGSEEKQKKTEKSLSLQWPNTRYKQVAYLLLLPIIVPLWLTIPDVRKQKSRKFFVITFLGSIIWIAVFSYLMVWWAHQVGETISIPEEVMGLTILAAGTSIPDLITSVIVARKGQGDMAVSSSVGCNIFDITVGLPVPWLLYSFIHSLAPVAVSSNGLFCAIVLLFIMLLFVIISIVSCKWRMNKALGFTMFLLYIIFVGISLLLRYRIIICPVSI